MAAEAKKAKISVAKDVNPFGETKTKKVPDWAALRPSALKGIAPLSFKRTMELDPVKWKKKVIEDGIYAVARYELQLFATHCSSYEKAIGKVVSANKAFKGKLPKSSKEETPELKAELDKAARELPKLYKSISKKIEEKVATALDEIQNDTGDNKKSLAAGKEALKRFDALDTNGMFMKPTKTVVAGLAKLSQDLKKADTDKASDAAFKAALTTFKKAENEFESVGKKVGAVVKYILSAGDKMARDKNAAPELQAFGKKLGEGTSKKLLMQLDDMVADFGRDIDDNVHFAAEAKGDADDAKKRAEGLAASRSGADKASSAAVKELAKLSKTFKTLTKDLK